MDNHGQYGDPIGGSSGDVANAQAQASLAGSPGQTTYITNLDLTFSGATGANQVVLTVAGLQGGTQSFVITVPAGAAAEGRPLLKEFNPPIPASGPGNAIVVTCPPLGTGNLHACLNVWGFQA